MKKWIFILTALFLVLLLCTYLLIPNIITLKSEQAVAVTQQGLHRMLLDSSNVAKWWPGEISTSERFTYHGHAYKIVDNNISLLPVIIRNNETAINTSLYIISVTQDSVQLAWVGGVASSYNPLQRIKAWLSAKELNSDMDTIMKKIKIFFSKPENIYGIKIEKALVMDSILITTGANISGYPGTGFVYSLVDKLKKYATANDAKETGYPMLNIESTDSVTYHVRVALPVDKALPTSGEIFEKRMPGLGNILVTEVRGGIDGSRNALLQLNFYARDYQRVPPAIPYYSLITDRTKQPDSSKWITKVYFPVM